MTKLIVGSTGCSINEIVKIFRENEAFQKFEFTSEKYYDFLENLEMVSLFATKDDVKKAIYLMCENSKIQAMKEIISKWVEIFEEDAQLSTLVIALNDVGLRSMSASLRERFPVNSLPIDLDSFGFRQCKNGKARTKSDATQNVKREQDVNAKIKPAHIRKPIFSEEACINTTAQVQVKHRHASNVQNSTQSLQMTNMKRRTSSEQGRLGSTVTDSGSDDVFYPPSTSKSCQEKNAFPAQPPRDVESEGSSAGRSFISSSTLSAKLIVISSFVVVILAIAVYHIIFLASNTTILSKMDTILDIPDQLDSFITDIRSAFSQKCTEKLGAIPNPDCNTKSSDSGLLVNKLYLYTENNLHWPLDPPLQIPQNLSSMVIKGEVNGESLIKMLKDTKNLENIQIISDFEEYWDKYELNRKPRRVAEMKKAVRALVLGKLESLKFRYARNSNLVLKLFAERIITENLKMVEIENSRFTPEDSEDFKALVEHSSNSINIIKITTFSWESANFFTNLSILPEVTNIFVEYKIDDQNNNHLVVGKDFCNSIPNVQSLVLKNGSIHLEELEFIWGCDKLETLDIELIVPKGVSNIQKSSFQNVPKSMKHMVVYFWFSVSDCNTDDIYIDGVNYEIIAESNC